jgi:type IV pilus assembly protein PilV
MNQPMKQQKGVSLIEVLITMLVVALALLGAASAQIVSLRFQITAQGRYQAMQVAEIMIERMRVNNSRLTRAVQADANDTRYIAGTEYSNSTLIGTVAAPNCGNADANRCTAAQAAQRDLAEWRQMLANTLPDGRGALLPVLGQPNQRRVVVMWIEKRETAQDAAFTDDTCPGTKAENVRCLNLWVTL